ncbi:hypothetical protein PYCCODRAFT_348125 [Trametes coccinea BRFM310]|uniref:Uncharacterized protein n=1 Tax=Trametes coccinea (strain BRFM310) TaxID=1353009 RepID=A0A1Y2J4L7_TRAC3|nr:hypothetical protein PYCCODRAFT_348125 [Trametes coccinea BRFM310]
MASDETLAASPHSREGTHGRYAAEEFPWFFERGVCDCHICRDERRSQSEEEALPDDILPLPSNPAEDAFRYHLSLMGYVIFGEEGFGDASGNDTPGGTTPLAANSREAVRQRLLGPSRAAQLPQPPDEHIPASYKSSLWCGRVQYGLNSNRRPSPPPLTVDPRLLTLSGSEDTPPWNAHRSLARRPSTRRRSKLTLERRDGGSSSNATSTVSTIPSPGTTRPPSNPAASTSLRIRLPLYSRSQE